MRSGPRARDKKRFVVLGAGTVEIRKGVDLFLETATRVLHAPGGENAFFTWIGAGYSPERDFVYSVYLRDQLHRAGIEDRVVMLPATSEIDLAYELSDVLLLSSRLDPLPNVAIDALCLGLPVVCFENTTGIADLLSGAGLHDACVAEYIDTGDLAEKVLRLAKSPDHYEEVSTKTREFAKAAFDFDRYAQQIETLGQKSKARAVNASKDIEQIVASGTFRPDFFDPSGKAGGRHNATRERLYRPAELGRGRAQTGTGVQSVCLCRTWRPRLRRHDGCLCGFPAQRASRRSLAYAGDSRRARGYGGSFPRHP